MDLKTMHYLVVLSKQKSINSASGQLFISQQALSKSIKNLEEELNVKILERNYQGIRLTEAGEIVIQFCENVLKAHETLISNLEPYQNEKVKIVEKVSVYIPPLSKNSFIHKKLKLILAENPQMQMYSLKDDTAMILHYLETLPKKERGYTVAIINTISNHENELLPAFLPPEGYQYYNFSKGHYFACVSKKSQLAMCKQLSMRTLIKEKVILASRPDYLVQCPIYTILREFGEPDIIFSSNSEEMWIEEIVRNHGIGFLADNALIYPQEVLKGYENEIALVEIKEKIFLTATCIVAKEHTPAVEKILQYILKG